MTIYTRGNESFIYFTDLCKPIETYFYVSKMYSFASHPAAKHPNAANLRLQTYDKNQWTFVINTAWALVLALTITLKVLLQKFPLLLRNTIPWYYQGIIVFTYSNGNFCKMEPCLQNCCGRQNRRPCDAIKSLLFFSHMFVSNAKFAAFWCFAAG